MIGDKLFEGHDFVIDNGLMILGSGLVQVKGDQGVPGLLYERQQGVGSIFGRPRPLDDSEIQRQGRAPDLRWPFRASSCQLWGNLPR